MYSTATCGKNADVSARCQANRDKSIYPPLGCSFKEKILFRSNITGKLQNNRCGSHLSVGAVFSPFVSKREHIGGRNMKHETTTTAQTSRAGRSRTGTARRRTRARASATNLGLRSSKKRSLLATTAAGRRSSPSNASGPLRSACWTRRRRTPSVAAPRISTRN